MPVETKSIREYVDQMVAKSEQEVAALFAEQCQLNDELIQLIEKHQKALEMLGPLLTGILDELFSITGNDAKTS